MDTIQIIRTTGGLVWRYRALCLFGAALISASIVYPRIRLRKESGNPRNELSTTELPASTPVYAGIAPLGGMLRRRLTGYGCLV